MYNVNFLGFEDALLVPATDPVNGKCMPTWGWVALGVGGVVTVGTIVTAITLAMRKGR